MLTAAILITAGYLGLEYRNGGTDPVAAQPQSSSATSLGPAAGQSAPASAPALQFSIPPLPSMSASGSAGASASPTSKLAGDRSAPGGPGGFPGPGNTGVPPGTQLATYSGPCTVTKNGTEITGKLVNCDPLQIRAQNVVISKSKVKGTVYATEHTPYSFTLEDSEVDAGMWQGPAVLNTNMTIRRSNIHGGATAVICSSNCDIRDSWLHGQLMPEGVDWHLGGFLANDTGANGRSDVTLVHNTIACDAKTNSVGGGCSGNVNLFPDFGPVSGVTVRNNFFAASVDISYCVYGGTAKGKAYDSGVKEIVFEGNVFARGKNRKCGGYGPVTSFNTALPGNVWKNNVWEDGTTVPPAN
ncbi:hypothetical protein ACQP2F_20925 [Actinoplanes sp. CA-030573]|uniref:hypothetical protein n=1 Tax=Actinoplanes sp. CA-030573 TaxID=3239898 RepID=UPI003D92ED55